MSTINKITKYPAKLWQGIKARPKTTAAVLAGTDIIAKTSLKLADIRTVQNSSFFDLSAGLWGEIDSSSKIASYIILGVGLPVLSFLTLKAKNPLIRLGNAILLAGTFGNIGESLLSGSVTDYLYYESVGKAFNLSDLSFYLGGTTLLSDSLYGPSKADNSSWIGKAAKTFTAYYFMAFYTAALIEPQMALILTAFRFLNPIGRIAAKIKGQPYLGRQRIF